MAGNTKLIRTLKIDINDLFFCLEVSYILVFVNLGCSNFKILAHKRYVCSYDTAKHLSPLTINISHNPLPAVAGAEKLTGMELAERSMKTIIGCLRGLRFEQCDQY